MEPEVTYEQLIEYYGSNINTADEFGMSRQAVYHWKTRGVPEWAQDEHRATLAAKKGVKP